MAQRETVSVGKGIWIDQDRLAEAGLGDQVTITVARGCPRFFSDALCHWCATVSERSGEAVRSGQGGPRRSGAQTGDIPDWYNAEGGIAMSSSSYETLLADASSLPVPDRIQLIEALWDTLPADSLPPLTDEWVAEIERRSAEYDAGSVQTVPWEQVRAEALRRVGATDADASR
jgi:putative addiction module component (TIGR02574 family)